MTSIDVVGGLYGENCIFPEVNELFGSGGRASMILAKSGAGVAWHYYCPRELQYEAAIALANDCITHYPHLSTTQITFNYFHPLSRPIYYPSIYKQERPILINGEKVLRFGMMEGDAIVSARACVYDPQSLDPAPFSQNGSTAEILAISLNQEEALIYTGTADESDAIARLAAQNKKSVVLIKAGADGCRVYEDGQLTATVPAFRSDRVYKIGSGDVFSAAFAYTWLIGGRSPAESAESASRCVANYVQTRNYSAVGSGRYMHLRAVPIGSGGTVHLIGSMASMSETWLTREAYNALFRLGVSVTTICDIDQRKSTSTGGSGSQDNNPSVLALLEYLDPRALVNIGKLYGSGSNIIVFSEDANLKILANMRIPNLDVVDDFATAVYRAVWAARE